MSSQPLMGAYMTPKDLEALRKLLDMAKTYKTANCLTVIDAERVILQLREQPNTVEVSGIWLRFIDDKAQVLAEVGGHWRLLMEESFILGEGNPNFSHIYEPSGIRSAPVDPLMKMSYAGSNFGKKEGKQ